MTEETNRILHNQLFHSIVVTGADQTVMGGCTYSFH